LLKLVRESLDKVLADKTVGELVQFKIGVMLETPRACLIADELAKAGADFFSFGTNDLTQMTYGFSRDDVSKFMAAYIKQGCLDDDPFAVLDDRGVLRLMKIAIEQIRAVNPEASIGICGEHGGDPRSITAALRLGVSYVSCSPARVPVAVFASAQTAIIDEDQDSDG